MPKKKQPKPTRYITLAELAEEKFAIERVDFKHILDIAFNVTHRRRYGSIEGYTVALRDNVSGRERGTWGSHVSCPRSQLLFWEQTRKEFDRLAQLDEDLKKLRPESEKATTAVDPRVLWMEPAPRRVPDFFRAVLRQLKGKEN